MAPAAELAEWRPAERPMSQVAVERGKNGASKPTILSAQFRYCPATSRARPVPYRRAARRPTICRAPVVLAAAPPPMERAWLRVPHVGEQQHNDSCQPRAP